MAKSTPATLMVVTLLLLSSGSFASISKKNAVPSQVKEPAQTLKPYTATYTTSIKGFPLGGSSERSLIQNADDSWTLSFSADMTFLTIKETSVFTSKGQQLIPRHYSKERTGLGKKPTEEATFDWSKNKVNWQRDDQKWSMNLKAGTQDNLSYQLKLRQDLMTSDKKQFSYNVADDDEIYQRHFVVEAEETIKTELGELKTVRVKIQRENNNRSTWIWFAKNYDYFIVKLLQEEKDTAYTVEISEIKGGSLPSNTKKQSESRAHPREPVQRRP